MVKPSVIIPASKHDHGVMYVSKCSVPIEPSIASDSFMPNGIPNIMPITEKIIFSVRTSFLISLSLNPKTISVARLRICS